MEDVKHKMPSPFSNHIQASTVRAMAILNSTGDYTKAIASFTADMRKNDETRDIVSSPMFMCVLTYSCSSFDEFEKALKGFDC